MALVPAAGVESPSPALFDSTHRDSMAWRAIVSRDGQWKPHSLDADSVNFVDSSAGDALIILIKALQNHEISRLLHHPAAASRSKGMSALGR
jgi:hypothetical protein